ncbi:MAG: N-acetylmuramic acid 6-phosphate etherase [Rhodobacteraceae bacterium]|nr:N-acetylmuramic acid 6-phosphate etherase [Paracoccaceae bacterium]
MSEGQEPTAAAVPVDAAPAPRALAAMLASQQRAAAAVAAALPAIEAAARAVAASLGAGGTLLYAAAGSSGLMALSDACELPGTFGVDPRRVRIAMAGGIPRDARMPGATEDAEADGAAAAAGLGRGDTAIVLSASGTTPYALAAARAAAAAGATVVAIANVPAAPLLDLAAIAVAIPTGPEVVEGSTRLGAGTAQKIALNMISTLAGCLMGHVHDGMMVNLVADNAKLRARAHDVVARIAGVDAARAAAALAAAEGDTKRAVLIAAGATPAAARALLAARGPRLADCLAALRATPIEDHQTGRPA